MDPIAEANQEHNAEMDSLVAALTRELTRATDRAAAIATAELFSKLTVTAGVVDRTVSNMRVLRSTERVLLKALEESGFQAALDRFVNSFSVQIPEFYKILRFLNQELDERFTVTFSKNDLLSFTAQQITTLDMLEDRIKDGAGLAKQKALFSVAGLPLSQLSAIISKEMGKSVEAAEAIADTALPGFYRTISDRGFQRIESGLKAGVEARYGYYGPLDRFNRPFCRRMQTLAQQGVTYNRQEQAALDNGPGQPKPVSIWCGGWRCRHQWLIRSLE